MLDVGHAQFSKRDYEPGIRHEGTIGVFEGIRQRSGPATGEGRLFYRAPEFDAPQQPVE
jgi:hypothetical protein